jgi:hypothetical protein
MSEMGAKKSDMEMSIEIGTGPGCSQDEKGDYCFSKVMMLWSNMFFESLSEFSKTI